MAFPPIEAKGQITWPIYWRANRRTRLALLIYSVPLLVIGVWCVVTWGLHPGRCDGSALFAMALLFLFFGVFLLMIPYTSARRIFDTSKTLHLPFQANADDEALQVSTELGSMRYPWPLFYSVKLEESLVLLYISLAHIYIFDPSFFSSDDEWRSFRTLVSSKVKTQRPRSNVSPAKTLILWIIIVMLVYVLYQLKSHV